MMNVSKKTLNLIFILISFYQLNKSNFLKDVMEIYDYNIMDEKFNS